MSTIDDILANTAAAAKPATIKRGAAGRTETDKERIDRQQAVINDAFGKGTVGYKGGHGENTQWFANGHETDNHSAVVQQMSHARDFNRLAPEVIDGLAATVLAEGRRDVVVTAKEIADSLKMNGKLTLDGKPVGIHAVGQMLDRADATPAVKYVLHLRQTIAGLNAKIEEARLKNDEAAAPALFDALKGEKTKLFETVRHEMLRAGDKKIQLRTREGSVKDVYAAVGPDFGKADFPSHADNLKAKLGNTPTKISYDQKTTAWDVRAEVYTPTPGAVHKVGEPTTGGMSVRGSDRGGKSIKTSGYIICVRCCNYSLYTAKVAGGRRAHRGRNVVSLVLLDIESSVRAIDVMCDAWGIARVRTLQAPKDFDGVPYDLVAGAFRGALRDGPLSGIVPGRSENHVDELMKVWETERRDPNALILSDLQQAVTRFSQRLDPETRADLDQAAGEWMVEHLGAEVERPMVYRFVR